MGIITCCRNEWHSSRYPHKQNGKGIVAGTTISMLYSSKTHISSIIK